MHILTQDSELVSLLLEKFENYLLSNNPAAYKTAKDFKSPLLYNTNYKALDNYIKGYQEFFKDLSIDMFKNILETKDLVYRKSESRKQTYYVKNTRKRTLLTPFGYVTFRRTEYVSKADNTPYCYLDTYIGLRKRQRISDQVIAMIISEYADSNSMIKTGKHIGRVIHRNDYEPVSRQTVYNVIRKAGVLKSSPIPVEDTPSTLYIMADEKFIALQNRIADTKASKVMIKAAVIFEGSRLVKGHSNRNQLINSYAVTAIECDFGAKLANELSIRYDLDKVEKIYLLGDGANWIKSLTKIIAGHNYTTKFALDGFHFRQAVNRITKDENLYSIIISHVLNNDKEGFKGILDEMILNDPDNSTLQVNYQYISNHFNAIQVLHNEVPSGCAMEQAISHILAAVFSSVPKAYNKENLAIYLENRTLKYNNARLNDIVLDNLNMKHNSNYLDNDSVRFDGLFDKKEYSSLNLSHFNLYSNPL